MRFYLDEELSDRIAKLATARGLDVVSSHACGRDRLSDYDQLRLASADERCMVTVNYKDFAPLCTQFLEDGIPHSGVLFVPSSIRTDRFAAIVNALARYDREHPDGVPPYSVDFLRP